MSVDRCGQTIMKKLFFREHARTEIHRLHHTTRCKNSKHCIQIRFIREIRFIKRDREGLGAIYFYLDFLEKTQNSFENKCLCKL